MKYFLSLAGVIGDAVDPNHLGWFEVSAFDFSADTPITSSGGSDIAGKTAFSPLNVTLVSESAASSALAALMSRQSLTGATLQAVDDSGQVVYNLDLRTVFVDNLADTSAPGLSLALDYTAIEVSTYAPAPVSGVLPAISNGWDMAAGKAVSLPSATPGGLAGSSKATTYFLVIDGINGGSIDADHKGWFEVADFSLGGIGSFDAVTLAAGTAALGPLHVAIQDHTALGTLMQRAADGKVLAGARLVGVALDPGGKSQTVYDLSLGSTAVAGIVDDVGQNHFSLDLVYDRISLKTKGPSETTTHDFAWDVTTKAAIASFDGKATVGTTQGSASDAVHYYLAINGINGDSQDAAHAGWFDVSNLGSLQIENGSSFGVGGFTAGKPTFNAMTIDVLGTAALPQLATLAATGKITNLVTLQGVAADNKTVVYNADFGEVVINSTRDNASNGFQIGLAYNQVEVTDKVQDGVGTVTDQVFGWNLTKAGTATVGSAAPTAAAAGSAASKYFMAFGVQPGDSLDADHKGWFEIDTFAFDLFNNTAPGFSPLSIGKAEHSAVTVHINNNTALAPLLGNLLSSKHLPGVTIQGTATPPLGKATTVYNLDLGEVVVTGITDASDGGYNLEFKYAAYQLETTPLNPDGSPGTAISSGYDFLDASTTVTHGGKGAPSGGAATSPEATRYFLAFDGLNGGSTDANHKGWFDVTGFSLGASSTADPAIGGGGGGGKATLGNLNVTLQGAAGTTSLATYLASGKSIKGATLQGVLADGTTVAYNLDLADVQLRGIGLGSGSDASLEVDYRQIEVTTTTFDALGQSINLPSVVYDRKTAVKSENVDGSGLASVTPLGSTGAVSATKYYMLIDGLNGGSRAPGHAGWFEVSAFDLGLDNSGSVVAGTAGKTTRTDLTVTLGNDTGLSALLLNAAQGKHLKGVKIEGLSAGGSAVYDLTLGEVLVSNVEDQSGQGFSLALDYGAIELQTKDAGGTASKFTTVFLSGATVPTSLAVNDAPVAASDTYGVHSSIFVNAATGVLINDSLDAGSPTLVRNASHGTLVFSPNGSFTYTRAAGYYGTDSFTYTVTDGVSWSDPGTVNLTVQDQLATAVADSYATTYNSKLSVAGPGVLGNDSDLDGDPMTALLVSGPSKGSLSLNPDGSFSYIANKGSIGTDSFTYKVRSFGADSAPTAVTLTIGASPTPTSGDDYLVGTAVGETISALGGNDTVDGAGGSDTLVGSTGNDLFIVDGTDVVVEVAAATGGTDTVRSSTASIDLREKLADGVTLRYGGVENITLSGAATLEARGDAKANVLNGETNSAANHLYGLTGNDTYIVGAGDVVHEAAIDGGGGIDTVASSTINVDLNIYALVENAYVTGGSNLKVIGNANSNALYGDLSTGLNELIGGGGADFYTVGVGDWITEAAGLAGGIDTVRTRSALDLDLTATIGTGGPLRFANVENLQAFGASSASLYGDGNNNALDGEAASGANHLYGRGGQDFYIVGAGDAVHETAADGTDTVQSSSIDINLGLVAFDNVEIAQLAGTNALNLTAALSRSATLNGNDANNVLTGGSLGDRLYGAGGQDDLIGGAGTDRFIFKATTDSASASGIDRILDFATGDKIDVAAVDAVPGGVDSPFAYHALGDASAIAIGDMRQHTDGSGNLVLDFYTAVGGSPTMSILVMGRTTGLSATDFFL